MVSPQRFASRLNEKAVLNHLWMHPSCRMAAMECAHPLPLPALEDITRTHARRCRRNASPSFAAGE